MAVAPRLSDARKWVNRANRRPLDIIYKVCTTSPSIFNFGQVRWHWFGVFFDAVISKGHGKRLEVSKKTFVI